MSPLAFVLTQGLNALALGALLFFISVGLTLIFGIMRIVNFAHGALYMLGAYAGFSLAAGTGHYWVALAAAPLAVAAAGLGLESVALRPLYRREPGAFLLVTFGLALVIGEAIRLAWGPEPRRLPVPPALAGSVPLAGEPFPVYRLFLAGFGLAAALALWQFLERTRLGLIIRATAQNAEMVHALGVNVRWVRASVFALGCGLAALGGVLAAPLVTAYLGMGVNVIVEAFVIVIIGGMGSLPGSAVGSLLVGVVQTFGNFYLPDFALAATYLAMIAVLVWRPRGLFGREE
ncbi:MAG TPA: branched-chain amino acid ABC transporter permease [Calidithermus sp.]|jgi:branched-chain amino acid transport system permease protein|nr:branched-chain amino acid ABC transporter permease [Calidithermus sp.]